MRILWGMCKSQHGTIAHSRDNQKFTYGQHAWIIGMRCDSNRIFYHGTCQGPLEPMDSYLSCMHAALSLLLVCAAPVIMMRGVRCTDPSNPDAPVTLTSS